MARIIAYPFRLGPDGSVAAVEQGTEQAHAQQLAVAVLTSRGERPLVPAFGVTDPAFSELTAEEVQSVVGLFGPPVQVEEVELEYVSDRAQDVTVRFSPA